MFTLARSRRNLRNQREFRPSLTDRFSVEVLEGRFLTAPAIYRATTFGGPVTAGVFAARRGGDRVVGGDGHTGDPSATASYDDQLTLDVWTLTWQGITSNQVDGPTQSPGSNSTSILTTVTMQNQTTLTGPTGIAAGPNQTPWLQNEASSNNTNLNWVVKDPGGGNLSGTIHIAFSANFSVTPSGNFDATPSLFLNSTYLSIQMNGPNVVENHAAGAISAVVSLPPPGSSGVYGVTVDLTYALPHVAQLNLYENYYSSLTSDGTGNVFSGDGQTSGFAWSLEMTVSP